MSDEAGEKSRKISGEALSSHDEMIGRCASKDFGTASVNFSRPVGRNRRGSTTPLLLVTFVPIDILYEPSFEGTQVC